APMRQHHWRVLPQGMKNSPTICQWYIARILAPIRAKAGEAVILHYMDDLLICAPDDDTLSYLLDEAVTALNSAGFELQLEKVQRLPPWKYLGLQISNCTVTPQRLEIRDTLRDLHQLCGSLNWIRPWLGITTEDLALLFQLLKGEDELDSPRALTKEAEQALERVQRMLDSRQAHQCRPDLPFDFIILGRLPHLYGVMFQWDKDNKDPLLIIEWVKARTRLRLLAGCEFTCIYLPIKLSTGKLTKETLKQLLRDNEMLQFALDSYLGKILIHNPAHKLFNTEFNLVPKEIQSRRPLKALTVFMDVSGGSHKSVMTWKDPQTQQWETDIERVEGSPQVAERFSEPINLVTDSAYVAGIVSRAEHAVLKEVSNPSIFKLLTRLIYLVSHHEQPYYVMHVRSHTYLPGFIAEGNRRADALAAPVHLGGRPDIFQQAVLSHQHFHQNVPGLICQFHLRRDQAKAIVATCPRCQKDTMPSLGTGVNPRGLASCEVWQTDVTHIPQFGRLKYVHVSVDTFSGAVYASAHAGERTADARKHLVQAFSTLGVPKLIKTDNGPAYTSKVFSDFLQQWGIEHRRGNPYSPTGQAVIERTHQTIKQVLTRQ
ncbi:POK8 protein, partial [Ptilorrhoa leucosticta]|nr:POK8 protein [Ptilorrhoa leucosticta]